MIAIPAVGLRDTGQTGRSAATGRARTSSEVARTLSDFGFRRLHLLANGASSSMAAVEDILRDTSGQVQVGGVSSASEIERLLRVGVDYVVVGDRGLDEPEWLAEMADLYPAEIAVSTDVHDRRVVRRGWVRTLPVDLLDLVDDLNQLSLRELLVAMPTGDSGAMSISDLSLLEDVAERSHIPVSVFGGVSTIADLRALEHRGIAAAVIEAERLLDGELDARRVAQDFGD